MHPRCSQDAEPRQPRTCSSASSASSWRRFIPASSASCVCSDATSPASRTTCSRLTAKEQGEREMRSEASGNAQTARVLQAPSACQPGVPCSRSGALPAPSPAPYICASPQQPWQPALQPLPPAAALPPAHSPVAPRRCARVPPGVQPPPSLPPPHAPLPPPRAPRRPLLPASPPAAAAPRAPADAGTLPAVAAPQPLPLPRASRAPAQAPAAAAPRPPPPPPPASPALPLQPAPARRSMDVQRHRRP